MSRNALLDPFLPYSIWKIPVGSSAVTEAANLPARTHKAVDAEMVIIGMDPTQPEQEIWKNGGQQSQRQYALNTGTQSAPASTDVLAPPPTSVPFNPNFIVPSVNHNYTCALIDEDGVTLYEFGNFCHATAGTYTGTNPAVVQPPATAIPGLCTADHGNPYSTILLEGLKGACGGSGLSTLGGTIRYGELTAANNGGGTPLPLPHALRVDLCGGTDFWNTVGGYTDYDSANDGGGYRWPATKADTGYNVSTSNNYYGAKSPVSKSSREGALYILPSTFAWNSLGSRPGKIFAQTLMYRGMYACNNAVSSRITINVEQTVTSDVTVEFQSLFGDAFVQDAASTTAWAQDMKLILASLLVVLSNTKAQYTTNSGSNGSLGAGGGSPLIAWSPGFGATLSAPFLQQVNGGSGAVETTQTVQNALTQQGSLLALHVGARVAPSSISQVGTSWIDSTAESGTSNTTVALDGHTVHAGNWVTVGFFMRGTSISTATPSVTDGLGNVYSVLKNADITDTAGDLRLVVFGAHIKNGGTANMVVTFGGATGAGNAVASEWQNTGEALDVAVVTATAASSTTISLSGLTTVSDNDLLMAFYAQKASPTLSAQAFSPAGTPVAVPDLTAQSTGADNGQIQLSTTIAGSAGAESFSATMTSGTWVGVLLAIKPAGSSSSAPTPSVSGGGTWTQLLDVATPDGSGAYGYFECQPAAPVGANGITITSESGSIVYEFYEIAAGWIRESGTAAPGTSNSPSVTWTPSKATDAEAGCIFWTGTGPSISSLPGGAWINDTPQQGLASNAGSSLVSGAEVPGVSTAQTYSGVLSSSSNWVAAIIVYQNTAVPTMPQIPTLTAGSGQVAGNWPLPSGNGSKVTSFTVHLWSGVNPDGSGGTLAQTITNVAPNDYSTTAYVITGLSTQAYSISVIAINANGSSPESGRSAAATPTSGTVPNTPAAPTCLPSDSSVQVIPPIGTGNGGSPITQWRFNCYFQGVLQQTQTQAASLPNYTFSGLDDNQPYGFTVIAINANGPSLESPVRTSTPVPELPAARFWGSYRHR